MVNPTPIHCTAFAGDRWFAAGPLADVANQVKAAVDGGETATLLIFDDTDSMLIELDLRGSAADVQRRLTARPDVVGESADDAAPPSETTTKLRPGPGRPRLGVVSREVTLLPRHWAWLGAQRSTASATLRKLVDQARRADKHGERIRTARDTTYRFISAMAGDRPGFEDATRALFAGDPERFRTEVAAWPIDIRKHVEKLAAAAFPSPAAADGA